MLPSPLTFAQDAAAPIQSTAKKASTDDLPPLPSSPIERAQKDGTGLPLSLKEATKRALQSNLDIAIQDTQEQLAQQTLIGNFGSYDPKLGITLAPTPPRAPTRTKQPLRQRPLSALQKTSTGTPLIHKMSKRAALFEASWRNGRASSDQAFSFLNPDYSSRVSVSFTQPLWKNFRIDSTRGNIKISNLDLKTSDSQFRSKVTDTVANVESKYWDLVSAIQDFGIKRESVKLAQITLRDNTKKVQVGTLAPIEITQAEFSLAQRKLSLLTSEENILNQENALRQLISNDRNAEIWTKVIVPTDTPDFNEYQIDLSTAIETALKNRPELEQYDIKLQQSDINIKMAQNSRKWQADLKERSEAAERLALQDSDGLWHKICWGLGRSYNNLFTEGLVNWTVQLYYRSPWGIEAKMLNLRRSDYKTPEPHESEKPGTGYPGGNP